MYAYTRSGKLVWNGIFLTIMKIKIPVAQSCNFLIFNFLEHIPRISLYNMEIFTSHLSFFLPTYEFIQRWQGRSVVFLLLVASLAEGQTWQQQICFLPFAQSMPFSPSNVNIHINVKCEYCSTKENKFLCHSVWSGTGRKICELFNLVLLPPIFSNTLMSA